ncbi:uncharacterized protein UV8b_01431 [Ustilaginoidea virens]|uniref:16 kDa allergen n=1 Tax=Ustilaginoidea virens TaxID=1159556 RepID=A0A1B5KZM5_USTVR|nr:uncharacterized protein UV8b_01431 [Ustilaginoidea virens]QUC17190.1 hypothetical protein UV8b_01431 [Ustilaginoidea virens]GAO16575.1 hypothetical protein UVI_02019870 [Ustilaginoidea virens]
MKTSVVALAALLGLASAQNAVVINSCSETVYVQSFPYNGGAPGPLTTLQPGQSFSEQFRPSGSTIKIAKTKTLNRPLFFGYSFSSNPDYAYYEFSTEWGNPFAGNRNVLSPGSGCEAFDCQANDGQCYSTPAHKKVYGCPRPVNLTAQLCK